MCIRIYDDPKHESYGLARRFWVILVGLYGTEQIAKVSQAFKEHWGMQWDYHIHCMITHQGHTEQYAFRRALMKILSLDI